MRKFWAFLIALLVALPALSPACAHLPQPAHPAMHHRHKPADCHQDGDSAERCLGCSVAAIPAPEDALATPIAEAIVRPVATPSAFPPSTAPALRDPPPRILG